MAELHHRPILTSVFYILGVLALLGALVSYLFFESFIAGISIGLTGIFYFGIGQAVDYLALTARSTDRLCTLIETSVMERLRSIESSLPTSSSTASQPTSGYYYATDGQQQGPLGAADLKIMRKDGLITDDTPVLREGDSQWRTYRDFLTLNR